MVIALDKRLHVYVCCACTVIIGALFLIWCPLWVAMMAACISSFCLSVGKEYGDKCAKGNHWCWWDILSDAVGIIIGCGVVLLISLLLL